MRWLTLLLVFCVVQSFGDTPGRYNVLSYGATGRGEVDESANIQAAIDAAYAFVMADGQKDNQTVYLPNGEYIIKSTIRIPSFISFIAQPGTKIFVAADFADTAIAVYGHHNYLSGFTVTDLGWSKKPSQFKYIALALHSPSTAQYVSYNFFEKINLEKARIGLDISTDRDGWVTSCNFQQMWITNCRTMIRTREATDRSKGIDANIFLGIQFQCGGVAGSNTQWIIENLCGDWNIFIGCFVMDKTHAEPDSRTVITGHYNTFVGGSMSYATITDMGKYNIIIDPMRSKLSDAAFIEGGTKTRGNNSFAATATRDAVHVPGLTSASVATVSVRNEDGKTLPVSADVLSAYCKTDSLIVLRAAGTTRGLKYNYMIQK